ncbi:hypothetical protein PAF17_08025 [Paracoccus sp. Z330]|uniref:Uncharacterized protein n=1 Tax=Paracoccus onchidii TaxID=3017813 RepID=A0ABT4ZDM8_9RHOB|nr:hypothetical protein [Paracoccus onchidii]MDB6177459.1 hypothetical protein [Paracoccus onchidii]
MIGVVVWSNAEREKAVIWCEDQASLAYLQGRVDFLESKPWTEPGDLVELESEMVGKLRHARKVRVLSEHACPELPEMLKGNSTEPADDLGYSEECHLRVVSRQDDDIAGPANIATPGMPGPGKLCVGR